MLTSGFFNGEKIGVDEYGAIYDRMYQAEFFSRYFSSFISNGVFGGDSTSFQVVENSGMSLRVKGGRAFINGYFCYSDEDIILNLDESDGLESRIDRIVLQLNMTDREISLKVLKGDIKTPPEAKEITRSGDIYELAIADILIEAGTPNIENSKITDLRLNNELCGFVTHVLEKVDTTTLYNQIQEDLKEFKEVEEANFLKWFENIKKLLNENAVSEHIATSIFDENGVHGLRYNKELKKLQGYDEFTGEWGELKGVGGGETSLQNTPMINIKPLEKEVAIRWQDPPDAKINDITVKKWKGTVLVKKEGSPPLSYDDGETLINISERNKYINEPYIDRVDYNKKYYYGIFPYDEEEVFNTSIQNIVSTTSKPLDDLLFSFVIDLDEEDPNKNITYLDDSVLYENFKEWEFCPLFRHIRPCILKDGVVQYYLDPNNYDLKENGEPSNLNGDDGDVMVEFPSILYTAEKITDKKIKFTISTNYDKYINDEKWFKLHLDYYNMEKYSKKLYFSAYISNSENEKLVSVTKNNYVETNLTTLINQLKNKNENYFLTSYYVFHLFNILCWLKFKTTNLASVFNLETFENIQDENKQRYTIGSLKTGGLFSGCGSEKPQEAIKIFGIEIFCNGYLTRNQFKTYIYSGCVRAFAWNYIAYILYSHHTTMMKGEYLGDGNSIISLNSNTITDYGFQGKYNDFIIYDKIGAVAISKYNGNSVNGKNYLAIQGEYGAGGRSSELLTTFSFYAKNDGAYNVQPNAPVDSISYPRYSSYFMYLPPNEEDEATE